MTSSQVRLQIDGLRAKLADVALELARRHVRAVEPSSAMHGLRRAATLLAISDPHAQDAAAAATTATTDTEHHATTAAALALHEVVRE